MGIVFKKTDTMKTFLVLALFHPAFSVATQGQVQERELNGSESSQCYAQGGIRMSCFAVDFSHQEDAEGCHAFCGKVDGCNLWSWKPSQSLCLAFATCTFAEGPVCEDCVIGEKACSARECHQQYKCGGNFVDSFSMSHIEECIVACYSDDACNWYTLEKTRDHCILYKDCDLHDETCTTCATGPKSCSHGYRAEDGTIFTQEKLEELMNEQSNN